MFWPNSLFDKFIVSGNQAHLALMGFLSCVDQVVLLQVGQLGKALIASLTFEGALATVDTQVHLRTEQRGRLVRYRVSFTESYQKEN